MKLLTTVLFSLFCIQISFAQSSRVRRVQVMRDQIVTIRTSLGIATIIQVPDRPNSVVVGNQEAFKVEYLDQAITIKPNSFGVKSNLYIYTDWKRYNIELVSGQENFADYVVYLENPKVIKPQQIASRVNNEEPQQTQQSQEQIAWTQYRQKMQNERIELQVKRLGIMREGIYLIEFDVTSSADENFRPDWLWLTQDGDIKTIHNLQLSSLKLKKANKIYGAILIRKMDVDENISMRLEMRRKKTTTLVIKKVSLWKQF